MSNDIIEVPDFGEQKEPVKGKMTLTEYEERYSSKENSKRTRLLVNLATGLIGLIVVIALFFFCKEMFEIHEYAGYGAIAVAVLAFIFLFIVPVVKIRTMRRFEVDVSVYSAPRAKRHNAKVRKALADNIINLYVETDGITYYSSKHVEILLKAREKNDNKGLRNALDTIYREDTKSAARNLIVRAAVRSGLFSALSQKDTTDALVVTLVNLQMVKDIIYLYGFRPSDAKLVRILSQVITDALVAYGLGNLSVGTQVAKSIGGVVDQIPILGSVVSLLVDGTVQGLSNAILTATIGHNTINYLMKEYRLQNILDDAEITESEAEFIATCDAIKAEMSEAKKPGKKKPQVAPAS